MSNSSSIHAVISGEIKRRAGISADAVIDHTPIAELGLDSLDFFEIILNLEEEHQLSIPIERFDQEITLAGIIASLGD